MASARSGAAERPLAVGEDGEMIQAAAHPAVGTELGRRLPVLPRRIGGETGRFTDHREARAQGARRGLARARERRSGPRRGADPRPPDARPPARPDRPDRLRRSRRTSGSRCARGGTLGQLRTRDAFPARRVVRSTRGAAPRRPAGKRALHRGHGNHPEPRESPRPGVGPESPRPRETAPARESRRRALSRRSRRSIEQTAPGGRRRRPSALRPGRGHPRTAGHHAPFVRRRCARLVAHRRRSDDAGGLGSRLSARDGSASSGFAMGTFT